MICMILAFCDDDTLQFCGSDLRGVGNTDFSPDRYKNYILSYRAFLCLKVYYKEYTAAKAFGTISILKKHKISKAQNTEQHFLTETKKIPSVSPA